MASPARIGVLFSRTARLPTSLLLSRPYTTPAKDIAEGFKSNTDINTPTPDINTPSTTKNSTTTPVTTNPKDLYLNPSQWKNLPPQRILDLYSERKAKLGHTYDQSPDELQALLSTSSFTGVSSAHIKKLYERGQQGALDISGGQQRTIDGLRPYQFDDLPAPAQDLIEQHREQRFYDRLAAYELPLLVQHRQEYQRPDRKKSPVTYRYSTYVGESNHPVNKKVVMSLKSEDLMGHDNEELRIENDKELHKFRLLAGVRYNYLTDEFKMSSEKFKEQTQNARYLSDTLRKLILESKDLKGDDFGDVPLDTRHTDSRNHKKRKNRKSRNFEFPKEWNRPQDAPKIVVDEFTEIREALKN